MGEPLLRRGIVRDQMADVRDQTSDRQRPCSGLVNRPL